MISSEIGVATMTMDAQENESSGGLIDLTALQLDEFSSAKVRMEDLFLEWITAENTQRMIDMLLEDSCSRPSTPVSPPVRDTAVPRKESPVTSPVKGMARKSPKKRTQAEMASTVINPQEQHRAKAPSHHKEPQQIQVLPPLSAADRVPAFYKPGQHKTKRSATENELLFGRTLEIQGYFDKHPQGIPVQDFVHITKRVCGFPSFFNLPLCQRIAELFDKSQARLPREQLTVKLSAFMEYWKTEIEPFDVIERFFRLVKRPDANSIAKDDFIPFIQELLHFHPGLDFLDNHEDFQRKYALTVITRIFYSVNTSRSGRLNLREVRRSNLVAEFTHVDEEEDINKVTNYFSYEHFYVMYCRFFELDSDNDARIVRDDLLKYADHAMNEVLIDRVFKVGVRAFSDGREGGFEADGMTYPDFIYFMLAEEDKTNIMSLRYWFNCLDLDGDGILAVEDMQFFYRTQVHRLTSLGHENILFEDLLCQMMDLIHPPNPHAMTLQDFTNPEKIKVSGILFDVLFNLHKLLRFEMRDPFAEKQKREDPFVTDWDRYAYYEYHRLAAEEEDVDDGPPDITMEVEMLGGNSSGNPFDSNDFSNTQSFSNFGSYNKPSNWLIDDDDDDDDVVLSSKNAMNSPTDF